MNRKEIIQLLVIVFIGIAGAIASIWMPKLGMFVCGACCSLSVVASIGLYLKNLAAKRIEKRINDYIQ
jgi:hypothetical protein